jgi:putative ABC exporter
VIEVVGRDRGLTRRPPRIRAQLGALVYLQLRSALRKLELVARDPLRRLAWAPYAVGVLWVISARIFSLHLQLPAGIWMYVDTLLPSLVFLLIAMSRAAGGRLYQSRAHAHLVGGLGLPIWLLVAWQHLQRLPLMLLNFGIFGVLLLPSVLGIGAARILETAIALILVLTLLGGAGLVGFSVRLRSPRLGTAWTVIALTIAAALAVPAVLGVVDVSLPWLAPLAQVATWSPGGLVVLAATGNLVAALGLIVLAAAALAFGIVLTRNLGPELAETSYRYFMLVDSARASGNAGMTGANMRLRDPVQTSTSTALRGAGVLVWKTWLEFRRAGTGRWRLVTLGLQLLFGVLAGSVWLSIRESHASSSLTTLLIGGVVLSMVAVGSTSGRQFGPFLRNPLFALNRDSLAKRLLAVLLTRQITDSIGSLATYVGIGLVLPASIPLLLVLVLVGRATAVAMLGLDLYVFAWLPSSTDRTMAMRIIRTLVLAVAVPLGTLFALWALSTPVPDLILLLPIPLLLLLGWWLIVLAGARLEGNGLAVAIAERR